MGVATPSLGRRRPVLERGQLGLLAVFALLTAAAWALTVHQARTMDMPMGVVARGAAEQEPPAAGADGMAGMDRDGWTWAAMMAAMMSPAAAPMVLLYRSIATRRTTTGGASDSDGLNDLAEVFIGTDPNNPDTDGDGWDDGTEVSVQRSPFDPDDQPHQDF